MKSPMSRQIVAAMAFGLAVSASAQAQNLIVNGDFEAAPTVGDNVPAFDETGQVIVDSGDYCCGLNEPIEGSQHAVFGGGGDSLGTLSQDFTTIAAGEYTGSFTSAIAGADIAGTDEIFVDFIDVPSSTVLGTFSANPASNDGNPVGNIEVTTPISFTALSTSTRILIRNPAGGGGTDPAIDAISVTLVPEPGSVTLLGLAAVSLLARRRRA